MIPSRALLLVPFLVICDAEVRRLSLQKPASFEDQYLPSKHRDKLEVFCDEDRHVIHCVQQTEETEHSFPDDPDYPMTGSAGAYVYRDEDCSYKGKPEDMEMAYMLMKKCSDAKYLLIYDKDSADYNLEIKIRPYVYETCKKRGMSNGEECKWLNTPEISEDPEAETTWNARSREQTEDVEESSQGDSDGDQVLTSSGSDSNPFFSSVARIFLKEDREEYNIQSDVLKEQTIEVTQDDGSEIQLTTRIRDLKKVDDSFVTVAEIFFKGAADGEKSAKRVITFLLDTSTISSHRSRTNRWYLIPLYDSIKFGKVSENVVQVAAGTPKGSFGLECHMYTITGFWKKKPGQKKKIYRSNMDCDEDGELKSSRNDL